MSPVEKVEKFFYHTYWQLRWHLSYYKHHGKRCFSDMHLPEDGKQMIAHFVTHDKFTVGYMLFMKKCFPRYHHIFFTTDGVYRDRVSEIEDAFLIHNCAWCFSQPESMKILEKAKKVIYTGVFNRKLLNYMPKIILNKSYFHFWGGDFYSFRDPARNSQEKIERKEFRERLMQCGGIINLIQEEWPKMKAILQLPEDIPHFAAPMRGDPDQQTDFSNYVKQDRVLRITVGNSATKENRHLEAFEYLRHIQGTDVEISCPLSYGESDYAREVIQAGHEIFGSRFHPITHFMPYEDYIQYLANCDVGIMNHNRQQAGGNIYLLLQLGKKVYIDPSTSLAEAYRRRGVTLYDVHDIENESVEELMAIPPEVVKENRACIEREFSLAHAVKAWETVFQA